MRGPRAAVAMLSVLVALTGGLPARAAEPSVPRSLGPSPASAAAEPAARLADPAAVLAPNWQRSDDRMVSTAGDSSGFYVLVADESDGYAWRTAATLAEPGLETDRWIGQVCVTESTRRAVVVYAPRSFAADPVLALRGGFAAIVDLESGKVKKLPIRTSLAYFNPGCGSGESAVLTQEGDETLPGTRLTRLDAAGVRLARPVVTGMQVSSAVPAGHRIVAAAGSALVSISASGRVEGIVRAAGTPFDLTVDASGAVVHADHVGGAVRLRRTAGKATKTMGMGALGAVNILRGGRGRIFVAGRFSAASTGAGEVTLLPAAGRDQLVSSDGHLIMDPVGTISDATIPLTGRMTATGRQVKFAVPLDTRAASISPAAATGTPVDTNRTCSVPRNDTGKQVYQPTPRQAEWAVDQAVRHALTVTRPAGWHNDGIGAYTPQGLLPAPGLVGGGYIPAQIMLGVVAQESNMSQASWHATSGEYGNPLVGNFYGTAANGWEINFAKADCGYGIAQVTDGMRIGDGRTQLAQTAIALDYAANIAGGVQILESKWNELKSHGMLVNGGDPQWIENWYLALWAYNSGYHPLGDPKTDGTVEGLGWLNNPANPHYPQDRAPFLENGYSDAAHPQNWPYQEKVIGWAGHPISTLDGAGYRAAWWTTAALRKSAEPPPAVGCSAANECQYGQSFPPNDPGVVGEPAGPCAHKSPAGLYNLQCYWHTAMAWKQCSADVCGHELLRFDPGQYPEQPDGTHYPPECHLGALPGGAIVVDDISPGVPSLTCPTRVSSSGTFSLQFGTDSSGQTPSKIDFHQLSGGWGGHFWFAHTWNQNAAMKVTGTWTPSQRLSGWTRVLVYIPDHGAITQQAHYRIYHGDRTFEDRSVPTNIQINSWIDLGVVNFVAGSDTPRLTLDDQSLDGTGEDDVAWDAAAFVHLAAKPKNFVVHMGDSYASGEGAGNYEPQSNQGSPSPGSGSSTGTPTWDACRRSRDSWSRNLVLPGQTQTIGYLADVADPSLDYHSIACSGARSGNLDLGAPTPPGPRWGGSGQFHEMQQLDSGFLNADTTLVTLMLGGNDVGFTDVLKSCTIGHISCPDYEDLLPTLDSVRGPLTTVLQDIHIKAPNAQIVVVGYPRIFGDGGGCISVVDQVHRARMDNWADFFAGVEQDAVAKAANGPQQIPVKFVDSRDTFVGHGVCDSEPGINGVVAGPSNGPGDYSCPGSPLPCPSRESYHPNPTGTALLAGLVRSSGF